MQLKCEFQLKMVICQVLFHISVLLLRLFCAVYMLYLFVIAFKAQWLLFQTFIQNHPFALRNWIATKISRAQTKSTLAKKIAHSFHLIVFETVFFCFMLSMLCVIANICLWLICFYIICAIQTEDEREKLQKQQNKTTKQQQQQKLSILSACSLLIAYFILHTLWLRALVKYF